MRTTGSCSKIFWILILGCAVFLPGIGTLSAQAINYLPTSTTNQVVEHRYYTLSYSEKHEQAEWVAYHLTPYRVKGGVERTDDFRKDPKVRTGSSSNADHEGSGYDRGHLAPAAAMAISRTAMSQSFYLSNMTPQDPSLNRGPWRQLEKQVRQWVRDKGKLYVVTGAVLNGVQDRIGPNNVSVPKRHYKVILDYEDRSGVAFLLPNADPQRDLSAYAVSIDKVEARTGINFFHSLPESQQSRFEQEVNQQEWRVSVSGGGGGGYQPANHYTNEADKININAASSAKLQELYGIGPSTAANIIDARPYRSVSALKKANGIGPATLSKIEDYVKAGPVKQQRSPDRYGGGSHKLNLNEASRSELKQLDGIGTVLSKRIMRRRPFSRVSELRNVKGIGPKTLSDLRSEVTAR